MLRVSGGTVRGRKLKGPKGLAFRPTTGRVKEFIFSVLGSDVKKAEVLDLFSGSGSLGIEALSRGAVHVTFVEQSAFNVHIIKQNLEKCGLHDRAIVLRGDVFKTLRYLESGHFKLILADPPFKMSFRSRIVESVATYELMKENGQLVIEHQDNDFDSENPALICIRQKKFGHCVVSIYEK